MRTLFLSCLTAVLVAPGRAPAQGDARAVLEKAVSALGGAERLARPGAHLTKMKGKFASLGASFTAEVWAGAPRAHRSVFQLDVGGMPLTVIQVLQGDNGWMDEGDGRPRDLDAPALADLKQSAYHDRVMSLLPLLNDKSFALTALGPATVEGRPAVGVRVASPGQSDITLHFDAESGLLLRSEYRVKKEAAGREVATAWAFGDYRELDPVAAEERVLAEAKVKGDGPSLLAYLRGRVTGEADRAKVKGLIKALAAESFEDREKASAALIRLGAQALSPLREAANGGDVEVASRAKACLSKIEAASQPEGVLSAALRLTSLRKPDGAAEVLLALAPDLTDDALGLELRSALRAVATRDGRADPAVEKALTDADPARRAAAAAALGRDDGAFDKQPGRRLLLTGLKKAMKVTMYQDGKKEMEWDVTEVRYFNRLDDRLFTRPR